MSPAAKFSLTADQLTALRFAASQSCAPLVVTADTSGVSAVALGSTNIHIRIPGNIPAAADLPSVQLNTATLATIPAGKTVWTAAGWELPDGTVCPPVAAPLTPVPIEPTSPLLPRAALEFLTGHTNPDDDTVDFAQRVMVHADGCATADGNRMRVLTWGKLPDTFDVVETLDVGLLRAVAAEKKVTGVTLSTTPAVTIMFAGGTIVEVATAHPAMWWPASKVVGFRPTDAWETDPAQVRAVADGADVVAFTVSADGASFSADPADADTNMVMYKPADIMAAVGGLTGPVTVQIAQDGTTRFAAELTAEVTAVAWFASAVRV
jgi:hypothetical protein